MLLRISLLILLIMSVSIGLVHSQGEATDCGDGLVQRLAIGDTAITQAGRLYDAPEGAAIARIPPDTALSITNGPECGAAGQSWWEVELIDGRPGWVPEGNEDVYTLTPTESEEGEASSSDDACADLPEPSLRIGQYANVEIAPPQFWLVRGVLEDATSNPLRFAPRQEVIILAGPRCHNNYWVWHVAPLATMLDTEPDEVWLAESDSQRTYMTMGRQPEFSPPYAFPEVLIEPVAIEETAPLVDVNAQISYFHGGGGGGGIYIDCWLSMNNSVVVQLTDNCLQQAFPPHVKEIQVRFYQPDGTLYNTRTYRYTSSASGPKRVLAFAPPSGIELQVGVWVVEYQTDTETRQRAYILESSSSIASLIQTCDGFSPILRLVNQEPGLTLLLNLMEIEEASGYVASHKVGQWEIPVAADGSAAARIAYPLSEASRYFWLVGETLASDNQVSYFYPCPSPTTPEDAIAQPLEYSAFVTGGDDNETAFIYAFDGAQGDSISLHVLGMRDEDDPFLELYDPSGELIAENDDAETPLWDALDAALTDFSLPTDGLYTLQVSNINDGEGFYYILLLEN